MPPGTANNVHPQRQPRERVNPCLLDKLLLEEGKLARGKMNMPLSKYTESVARDLTDLLYEKTHSPDLPLLQSRPSQSGGHQDSAMDELTLADFPEASRSVLTFGLPDMSGKTQSDLDLAAIERLLEERIRFFEPRFDPDTLRVQVLPIEAKTDSLRLHFKIVAELWAFPQIEQIDWTGEIDLVSGQCNVQS
jgi:type VI secretion system lysozyme-like protein